MSERYIPLLDGIKAQLQAIAPGRVVTRNWKPFQNCAQADLARGIWTIRTSGIPRYPYEASDGQFATDSLRATENGRMRIVIVGQLQLPPGATGEAIDAAEFELINELEQLADRAIETDGLEALLLKDVAMSQQVEAPFAWVYSTWEVFSVN